jgi:hypothetical protein
MKYLEDREGLSPRDEWSEREGFAEGECRVGDDGGGV